MAIGLVQSTKKIVTAVNNTTLAYGSNLTAGNLVCNTHTHFQSTSQTITTPTDTLTHTYAGMTAEQTIGTQIHIRSFYKENCSAGANTVTFDVGGAATGDLSVLIAEFSNVVTASAIDKTQVGTGTGTAVDSGATATTTQANEMVWGAMVHDNGANITITETGSASLVQENEGGAANMPIAASHKEVTATGAQNATWTIGSSSNWAAHVATFKDVTAGGGGATVTYPMLERMTRGLERGLNHGIH